MAAAPTAPLITIDTPRGPVRLLDTGGDGRPILLIHSLLVDGDLYARLVPRLTAQGHRCLVPELPLGAHGLAMHPDADLTPGGLAALLVDVLDAVAIDQVDVVGVDTGGALTQVLMAEHRDRVGSVVLTACDAYDAFPPRSFAPLVAPLQRPAVLWLVAQLARLRPARRLATVRVLTHAGTDADTVRRWCEPMLDPAIRRDLRKVVAGMDPAVTLAAAEANRDFPRPVLVAWGDDARAFPRRLGERLAADLPHARLVTLPDCAAFAALDQPELLSTLIDDHVHHRTAID